MAGMRTVSVVTLNTYLCRVFGVDLCPQPDRRADLIREGLRRLDPDIVCLQEMWDPRLAAEVLAGWPGHQVAHYEPPSGRAPMGAGLVLASRIAIREARFVPIVTTWRPKEMLARRGVLVGRIEDGPLRLDVAVTHLGMGTAVRRRRQHAAMLAALPESGPPCILCGDLNLAYEDEQPDGFSLLGDLQARGFRDVLREAHGQAADDMITIARANPLVHRAQNTRIDHLWVRSGADVLVKVVEARVVFDRPIDGLYPSDHFGVLAHLCLQS